MGAVVTAPSGNGEHNATPLTQEQLGISPMRRGRPGKTGQNQSISAHPSNLQSEWHVPSTALSSSPPGSASAPAGHAPIPGAHNPYAHPESGFGDSFAPSIPTITGGSMASTQDPTASSKVTGSKTANATAAIFEELSNPGSTVKQPPTLASLAAERSGGGQSAPSSSGTSQRVQQYMQQFSHPSSRQPSSAQDLRRVSPGKPLGPRSALPTPSAMPTQPRTPSESSTSKSKVGVEEGTQTEKTVLSPPLKPPKPNLVSRASQTSPTLLNEWKQKEQETIKGRYPQRSSSYQSEVAVRPAETKQDEGQNLERFPSIDDWESTGFSPPTGPSKTANLSPQQSLQNTKKELADLLGDDVGGMSGQPPLRSASYRSTDSGSGRFPARQISSSSAGKQEPIAKQSTSSSVSTSNIASQPPGLKSSVLQVASPADSSSSDSEPEEGPEEPTGHHYGTSTPPALLSSPSSHPVVADPPTIVATTAQRSPGRGPPILAPKPKIGGISSIVSQYENISTSDPASMPSSRQRSDSNKLKPTKPPKPAYASTSSQNSYGSLHSSRSTASVEDFSSRYPSLREEGPSHSASLPPAPMLISTTVPPRQNSDPSNGNGRARPQSMHFPASPAAPQNGSGYSKQPHTLEEEAEEEYQGVANLRDRWQKMHNGASSEANSQQQDGLSRRATFNSNRWNRN